MWCVGPGSDHKKFLMTKLANFIGAHGRCGMAAAKAETSASGASSPERPPPPAPAPPRPRYGLLRLKLPPGLELMPDEYITTVEIIVEWIVSAARNHCSHSLLLAAHTHTRTLAGVLL